MRFSGAKGHTREESAANGNPAAPSSSASGGVSCSVGGGAGRGGACRRGTNVASLSSPSGRGAGSPTLSSLVWCCRSCHDVRCMMKTGGNRNADNIMLCQRSSSGQRGQLEWAGPVWVRLPLLGLKQGRGRKKHGATSWRGRVRSQATCPALHLF